MQTKYVTGEIYYRKLDYGIRVVMPEGISKDIKEAFKSYITREGGSGDIRLDIEQEIPHGILVNLCLDSTRSLVPIFQEPDARMIKSFIRRIRARIENK